MACISYRPGLLTSWFQPKTRLDLDPSSVLPELTPVGRCHHRTTGLELVELMGGSALFGDINKSLDLWVGTTLACRGTAVVGWSWWWLKGAWGHSRISGAVWTRRCQQRDFHHATWKGSLEFYWKFDLCIRGISINTFSRTVWNIRVPAMACSCLILSLAIYIFLPATRFPQRSKLKNLSVPTKQFSSQYSSWFHAQRLCERLWCEADMELRPVI